jgi:diadenosine tetraphosphate (Ap4A) HIT family hydrolase
MKQCSLCDANLGPVVAESTYWRLILNKNQDLLGKCFLALRRHLEVVPQLLPAKWADLHKQLAQATQMLSLAFQPDHFNYAFLQNQDRHIHLHIIPRYDKPRVFAGVTFDDPDYPCLTTPCLLHLATSPETSSQPWLNNCGSFSQKQQWISDNRSMVQQGAERGSCMSGRAC